MLLNILYKSVLSYFIVMICLKFMGKREVGQVSLFDFAIILIISDILVIGIDENNKYYWFYFIAIIVLAFIQRLLSMLLLKIKKLRKIVDGAESILVYDGKLNLIEMRKQRYNMDDLIVQLRLNKVSSLSEIKYLILENNGRVSVFTYKDNPLNPFPLIVSGKIEYKNLKLLNLSEEWLYKEIKDKKIEDICYASFENNKLFIIPFNNK